MPVIAPRLAPAVVHALLHHGPLSVVGDEEAVKIEIEAVLHRGAVDLGDKTAGAGQGRRVETDPLAEQTQFLRRLARMLAAAAADVNSEFVLQRSESALQRADHTG